MPTIVGLLTFVSKRNNILGLSEPKKAEPAIAAMHGPHSLVRFGDYVALHKFSP